MASVSKAFKENFEAWAAYKIEIGEFTEEGMEEMRGVIRKDLTPGDDQLRFGCFFLDQAGNQITAVVDDHEERYAIWSEFFADEAAFIKNLRSATGINERIRASIAEERKAA